MTEQLPGVVDDSFATKKYRNILSAVVDDTSDTSPEGKFPRFFKI